MPALASSPGVPSAGTDVDSAVAALRAGGLVGLPTETVYGLGADAENRAAVARVYAAKGRPADHPLIVHVHGTDALDGWVGDAPAYALTLAATLWPGPLTLVVPRGPRAGDHVTGGQPTVGVRAPDHPVARAVLAAFGGGIAAPSANRFGRVSPTRAQDVLDELGATLVRGLDVVLDGGPSRVGLESTILDCTGEQPVVLRPGAVGADEVARAVGVRPLLPSTGGGAGTVRAPGTLPAHYAPAAEVIVPGSPEELADLVAVGVPTRVVVGLLAPAPVPTPPGVVRLAAPDGDSAYAHALYRALREADALGLQRVVAVPPAGDGPLAAAVADRLRRAAAGSRRSRGGPGAVRGGGPDAAPVRSGT